MKNWEYPSKKVPIGHVIYSSLEVSRTVSALAAEEAVGTPVSESSAVYRGKLFGGD